LLVQPLTTASLARGGKCVPERGGCHYPADINAVVIRATLMHLYS